MVCSYIRFFIGYFIKKKKKNSEKERNHTCFETFKRNHFIWAQIKILFGLFLSETFHAALAHCLGEIVSPRKICLCFLRGDRLDAARFAVALQCSFASSRSKRQQLLCARGAYKTLYRLCSFKSWPSKTKFGIFFGGWASFKPPTYQVI